MLSRFHPIPERHGRTDRQTDRQRDLLYRYRAMAPAPLVDHTQLTISRVI